MNTRRRLAVIAGRNPVADYIDRMNKTWGWLFTENVAPVWIGEMGASMSSAASKAWGQTLLDYMNGKAAGGPTFSRQPAADQRRLVGLGLPDGAEPEWLHWGGRPGAPRAGTLFEPIVVPLQTAGCTLILWPDSTSTSGDGHISSSRWPN